MSVEMWPVSGSTTPAGLRTFGSKKSVARLRSAPAGSLGSTSWPLLPWRSISPPSDIPPNLVRLPAKHLESNGCLPRLPGLPRPCSSD